MTIGDIVKEVSSRSHPYSRYQLIGTDIIKVLDMFNSPLWSDIPPEDIGNGVLEENTIYFEIDGDCPELIHNMTRYLRCRGYAVTAWDNYYTIASENGHVFNDYLAEWADGNPEYRDDDCWDAFVVITDPSGIEFEIGAGAVDEKTMAYYKNIVENH